MQRVAFVLIGVFIGCLLTAGYFFYFSPSSIPSIISPVGKIIEKPLERYGIERLGQLAISSSQIILGEPIATTSAYQAYQFSLIVEGKKATGLAHIPVGASDIHKMPVIVQFRGYVEREKYTTGVGTEHSGEVFSRNGFITLAPDFLGYGESDMPSTDVFEERFQTYLVGLSLLASVETLPMADAEKIGIWGHSNGGQIALTVLEASQKSYPTTLWAPVTKPFPYSILYYTDEAEDRGKLLRRVLAKFEQNYDVDLYDLTRYVDHLAGPLQLHQGTADDAVPVEWSDEFVQSLKEKDKAVMYFTYPGTDHNLQPAWNTVVARDVAFFTKYLK